MQLKEPIILTHLELAPEHTSNSGEHSLISKSETMLLTYSRVFRQEVVSELIEFDNKIIAVKMIRPKDLFS